MFVHAQYIDLNIFWLIHAQKKIALEQDRAIQRTANSMGFCTYVPFYRFRIARRHQIYSRLCNGNIHRTVSPLQSGIGTILWS